MKKQKKDRGYAALFIGIVCLAVVSMPAYGHHGTGIAYDGTNFFVSSIATKTLRVYDTAGTFIRSVDVSAVDQFGIEDLSFDYSQRPDTGGVPEPSTYGLLAGIGLLALTLRRQLASKNV